MDDHDHKEGWFSEEIATFGDRLAAAREAAGLSQKELAQQVGIKTGTLRNWEEDLSEPRANRLSILAGILGVSLRWLLHGEGEGLPAPDEAQADVDIAQLMIELRSVRAQMGQSMERLAQIEKRLRAVGRS